MAQEFEDDGDFNSEQVQKIAQDAVGQVLVNQNTTFQRDKAGQWSQQIIELILKSLAQLGKDFKYVVTCILPQNNGAGLHSAATCWWDAKTDGFISVRLEHDTYICCITVVCL